MNMAKYMGVSESVADASFNTHCLIVAQAQDIHGPVLSVRKKMLVSKLSTKETSKGCKEIDSSTTTRSCKCRCTGSQCAQHDNTESGSSTVT